MKKLPRILLSSGEPAGVGPDLVAQIAQETWAAELLVIGDPLLLAERAKNLNLELNLIPFEARAPLSAQVPGSLKIIPLSLAVPAVAGELSTANSSYVMHMLGVAADLAEQKIVDAIVTAPVHKAILQEAGFDFLGHTEFLAKRVNVEVVMLFVMPQTRVALLTTHLPLAAVPAAITSERAEKILRLLHEGLRIRFGIEQPRVLVCGLNPHAGENGYLGREEIEIITPVIEKLRSELFDIVGPLPADTIFTERNLKSADAILAMYHDQALPVVKTLSFGHAVNVTLGLPYVRTSVDHGTAVDVAGTPAADAGSLRAALELAIQLAS